MATLTMTPATQLSKDEILRYSRHLIMPEVGMEGQLKLKRAKVLSREDMLHLALMASENRAASALSRYYPGGRPAFITTMNAKAAMLGMNSTHFVSPNGLTSENVSTAFDLAKLVQAAYQYPLIREFSTDQMYALRIGRYVLQFVNSNRLIGRPGWDIGLQKTGFINESGGFHKDGAPGLQMEDGIGNGPAGPVRDEDAVNAPGDLAGIGGGPHQEGV